jgi:segregation and condensation protein B
MDIDLTKEAALLETVFYLESEPLDEASLARISGLGPEIIGQALETLRERLQRPEAGLELIQISGGWTISPKKDFWETLRERYGKKNDQKLSRAAMETLSIIAYSQPVTRGEIESIRGVAVDNMMKILLEKDLIKEVGRKDVLGKPIQYGTTKEFLKVFRLNSIADLPKLDDMESERYEPDGEQ